MKLEYITCGNQCMLQCPFKEAMIGSKSCGECEQHVDQVNTNGSQYVTCKKATAVYDFLQRMDSAKREKINFTAEDLKLAFKAGGDIVSWSDMGIENKWSNFDEWFTIYCSKK